MFDEFETVKAERLADLAKLLDNGGADDGRERFAKVFFRHAAAEDVARYSVAELDAIATEAWTQLQSRRLGSHRVRVFDPALPDTGGQQHPISVVEVINDDMPFLFASVMNELQARGLRIDLVVHPILDITRDAAGHLTAFAGEAAAGGTGNRESFLHIQVDRLDVAEREQLAAALETVLRDVRRTTMDWDAMRRRIRHVIRRYEETPPPIPNDRVQEATSLLDLLVESDFILIGVREYRLDGSVDDGELVAVPDGGLGILRDPDLHVLRRGGELVVMTAEIREFLKQPDPLIITKANARSRVHRRAHLDYVGAKLYDATGALSGELRVVGLFTSDAYTKSVLEIPYVRRKVRAVMTRLGFDPHTHSGKALLNILETYPRDELFQIDEALLADFALAILQLIERPRVRVLPRPDRFDRFVSVIVFMPRERYSTDTRTTIETFLSEKYEGGISARYTYVPEGPLVRLHVIVRRSEGVTPTPTRRELEDGVEALIRTWSDDLFYAARSDRRLGLTRTRASAWGSAFDIGYQATYTPTCALGDIRILSRLTAAAPVAIEFSERADSDGQAVSLKIFHGSAPLPLSSRVPVLEDMGFIVVNERTFRVRPPGAEGTAYVHDMTLRRTGGGMIDVAARGDALTSMFMAVWDGKAESDELNALLLNAGIGWREVAMLRAISRYLRQTGIAFAQDYIADALNRNPKIAAEIVRLFVTRFDPDLDDAARDESVAAIEAGIEAQLDEVASLSEDTIVRRFLNITEACLRTNYFQVDKEGCPVETFAFKIASAEVTGLPLPHPFREIWVYSPRVEGVHLRFGYVARGGLRWSDRPQDFRTEILGLVKAQQVKNAVIVPVGAKGGFFPKRLPDRSDRAGFAAEGKAAYEVFVSTLLDITDDIGPDGIVPPARVVRRDGDDAYLVVAADKGTATFSDTANAISAAHDFWLDDAFASGGSAGYDHKAMGITARGAWEAVKRHFQEMDRDIQTEPFTCIGVGDMSGDVFGNGMLLSHETRLLAAFDHRDIFIDPDPDPAASYEERARLFDLAGSTWQSYDKARLSPGGAVFSRSLKSIEPSPEARQALALPPGHLTPQDLISAILKAPADLLWFGGIGTYVRAGSESNADVGDKTNDPIRITAEELSVKVIGEGANLGMTQAARVAFCRNGGRCNSDAIDNSAGVNTSDVEVNIKIALSDAERSGRLDRPARNVFLEEMTDAVAERVLRNNYLQTLAISLAEREGPEAAGFQMRLMQVLEQRAGLDREIEGLPPNQEIASRVAAGSGLTRPEIGVLLAYAKIMLYDDLVASAVPDDPFLGREIQRYFPDVMDARFPDEIQRHRLRREIIATMLANSLINRGGPTFVVKVGDQTGADMERIALAFATARGAFSLSETHDAIDTLDNKISGALQLELYGTVRDTLTETVVWFIRNWPVEDGVTASIDHFRQRIAELVELAGAVMPETTRLAIAARTDERVAAGVPEDLAARLAALPHVTAVLDIILVADSCSYSLETVARTYFEADAAFSLSRLDAAASALSIRDYYEGLALDRSRRLLSEAHRRITLQAVEGNGADDPRERIAAWTLARGPAVDRTRNSIEDIVGVENVSMARISVAASLLSDLAAAGA